MSGRRKKDFHELSRWQKRRRVRELADKEQLEVVSLQFAGETDQQTCSWETPGFVSVNPQPGCSKWPTSEESRISSLNVLHPAHVLPVCTINCNTGADCSSPSMVHVSSSSETFSDEAGYSDPVCVGNQHNDDSGENISTVHVPSPFVTCDDESGCSDLIRVDSQQNGSGESIKHFLARWACQNNVTHTALSQLLNKLKTHNCCSCFVDMPSDARTLLSTPRTLDILTVPPGKYVHIGISTCLNNLLLSAHDISAIPSCVKLMFFVDGLPLTKSSASQLWPILGKAENIPNSGVFVIGCYHGDTKPDCADVFLSPFVNELCDLLQDALRVKGKMFSLEVKAFICDAPARAFVLGVKTHSGYFSCTKCTEKGEFIERRVVYNGIDAPLRTDDDFSRRTHPDHHVNSTVLEQLPIGLVSKFPLDYMHLVCIGVMKKMLLLWTKGDVPYRLPSSGLNLISKSLLDLKSHWCSEFVRPLRALKYIDRWKATELRAFLLYAGPIVLKAVLPRKNYEHFLVLHTAIRILASPSLCMSLNGYAQQLLRYFVNHFGRLYGHHQMSYNVHGLIHLPNDVLMYGCLDNFSAFAGESFLQRLKRLVRSGKRPLEEVCRRICELMAQGELCSLKGVQHTRAVVLKQPHADGPLLPFCKGPEHSVAVFPNFTLSSTVADNCCMLSDSSVVLVANFAFDEGGNEVLIGRKFETLDNLFDKPMKSSELGVVVAYGLSKLTAWPLSEIQSKCVLFPHGKVPNAHIVLCLVHSDTTH